MTTIKTSQKADVVRLLLESEGRVMLCLDATRPGVVVPRRFASDIGLRLILNSNMPQSIDIGPDTIESELRFGGIPHFCVIPYEALWGVFNPDSKHGMFWTESMPEEIRAQHGLEETTPSFAEPAAKSGGHPPSSENKGWAGLRVIDGGGEPLATEPAEKRPPPNLRLVT
ncbi:MAG: hypothetical protein HQM02_03950 [Magnetococcales bacterium]|nr:hypothetical protein [Magnetococcales bacterium]